MNKTLLYRGALRGLLTVAAIVVIVGFAYTTNPNFLKTPQVESSTAQNVSGWIWSAGGTGADSNAGGWVSFNSTDCDTDNNGFVDTGLCGGDNTTKVVQSYGVNVDMTTGNFSGTAWSENMGWISFDRATTGNPPAAPYSGGVGPIAHFDTTTGKVTGWARALIGCENIPAAPCPSGNVAGNNAGGWDGWIKLAKDPADLGSPDYGVAFSGGKAVVGAVVSGVAVGYAWGSDSGGWFNFGSVVGGVNVGPKITGGGTCTTSSSDFSWSGTCQTAACTPADGGTFLTGVEVGSCSSSGSNTITRTCTASTACPVVSGGANVCGNAVCEAPGETLLKCPKDCKPGYKTF